MDSLANLLLKLHLDQATGVMTVKDERRTIRIYFQGGDVVYADGIDKEARLLKKIAAKKRLDPDRLAELDRIKQRAPFLWQRDACSFNPHLTSSFFS